MSSRKILSSCFYFLFLFAAFGILTAAAQTKAKPRKRASSATTVSKPERETIEKIVREYLIKNPQVIREALLELQAREERERSQTAAANLKIFESEIYKDKTSPVAGNANGDVSVVVFYDYYCSYCRKTLPDLKKLTAKDSSVRVIYKELPILSQQSHLAALAALAAHRQGKFAEFHEALLASSGTADENGLKEIAGRCGLNWEIMQKDITDPKLNAALERNLKLAASLNINGTPAYLIGDQLIPGAIDFEALEKMIAAERTKSRPATDTKQ